MKKIISCICVLFLAFVCSVTVLAGCRETKDPDEIVGVYSLKQMEIIYNDDEEHAPAHLYNVDSENNESEMLKELSKIVYDNLNQYRYEIEKSENYVFKEKVFDKQSGNYATTEAQPGPVEWDKLNDMFILKETNGQWRYIRTRDGGYYYVGWQFSVNNTDFKVEQLRGFMQENNIHYLSILYVLEK